ncbi:MAG: hypothetical protein ABH871_08615 [Pseudomonadota bacterium]
MGTSESKSEKKLLERLKSVLGNEVENEEKEAAVLEAQGYLLGLEGRSYAGRGESNIPAEIDFQTLSAAEFLSWIRNGQLSAVRRQKKDEYAEGVSKAFYAGAREVFGGSAYPAYLKQVCKTWVNFSRRGGEAGEKESQRIGRETNEVLQSYWRLGHSGQLAASIINTSLYRVNVVEMLLANGWLLGTAGRLRRLPESASDAIEVQSALLLEKNQKTILLRALMKGDSAYVEEAARQMPGMLRTLYGLVDEMRRSRDGIILEAASLLGGEPGTKRKGNINSVICGALNLGTLGNYIQEVCNQFRTGKMLKDLYAGIRSLEERGEKAAAEAFSKNKGSIINHALLSGQLAYVGKVIAAFEGEDGFIKVLDQEIASLKKRGEQVAADALSKNKGSIISHALTSGQVYIFQAIVAVFKDDERLLAVFKADFASA